MVEDLAAAGQRVLALRATRLDGKNVYADAAGPPVLPHQAAPMGAAHFPAKPELMHCGEPNARDRNMNPAVSLVPGAAGQRVSPLLDQQAEGVPSGIGEHVEGFALVA
jgi:hypothetical protein